MTENDGLILRSAPTTFPPQFSVMGVDGISLATTPIQYFDHDGSLLSGQQATGFFFSYLGRYWLVTALHCLTGRNVFTGKYLDTRTGFEPKDIQFFPSYNVAGGVRRWRARHSLFDSSEESAF